MSEQERKETSLVGLVWFFLFYPLTVLRNISRVRFVLPQNEYDDIELVNTEELDPNWKNYLAASVVAWTIAIAVMLCICMPISLVLLILLAAPQ